MNAREVFSRSDFVRTVTGSPSKLFPGRIQSPVEEFLCPSCKTPAVPPQHGKHDGCACGLRWYSEGNSIEFWESDSHGAELNKGPT